MQADVTTLDAKKAGTVELPDDVFGLEPRPDILHRMVRYQLAKRRAGTRSVQDRSEVNYTGAKLYRQKGTGRPATAAAGRRCSKAVARPSARSPAATPSSCRKGARARAEAPRCPRRPSRTRSW